MSNETKVFTMTGEVRFAGDVGPTGPTGPRGNQGEQGPKGEPGTTNYNDLENKPYIPVKVSDYPAIIDTIKTEGEYQEKIVTPTTEQQNITADAIYVNNTTVRDTILASYPEHTNIIVNEMV